VIAEWLYPALTLAAWAVKGTGPGRPAAHAERRVTHFAVP